MNTKAIKKYGPLTIFVLFSFLLICQNISQFSKKEHGTIQSDVAIYYTYLPATIINKDPLFELEDSLKKSHYRTHQSPIGRNAVKTSMGVAFMDLPFFLVGHLYALNNSAYKVYGYSLPYQFMISISSIVYMILGLFFLWQFLKRRFSEGTSIITVLFIGLGTNLFYYSTYEAGMSHPCTFFLLSALLYLIQRWMDRKRFWRSFLIGIILGLIVLVRPINILFILPIIIIFKNQELNWKVYFKDLILPFSHTIMIAIGGFLIILPQLIFWEVQTGSILSYSYGEESFFWLHPHIWEGLFSIRKGWFIYTPIMFFALFGMVRLYKVQKSYFWAIIAFLPLFLYITFSWWCWWYGGGFGARSLIDILPFMALPLAALVGWSIKNKLRATILIIPCAFVYLNLYQTWQYSNGIIHYDGMTWESYKEIFLKSHPTNKYWEEIERPDYENAIKYGVEKNYTYLISKDTTAALYEKNVKSMIEYITSDTSLMNPNKQQAIDQNQPIDSLLRIKAKIRLKEDD